MARWIVAGLVVLNLMLGAGVYLRWESKAEAQIGGGRASVAMVGGSSNGKSVTYFLDVNTGMLDVVEANIVQNKIIPIVQRNVAADLKRP